MPEQRWGVVVKRDDLAVSEVRPEPAVPAQPGEVCLAVEAFGLTTNNATYARFGDSSIPFFNAFPAPQGYGRVPIWGYARVVDSRHPEVAVGTRYFGYLPMATHHTVIARPTGRGLFDASPRRDFLHPWYRTLQPVGEPDELDDYRALVRPVFPASVNLADMVARQAAAGARSVLVTSASSKTAIGMVDELRARQVDLSVTGITGAGHVDFVERLGRYDTVLPYEALASAPVVAPAVYVDLTGDAHWRGEPYRLFPKRFCHTALIGFTHSAATIEPPPGLRDPVPEVFFTPAVEDQAVAAEGADAYHDRYARAERRFLAGMPSWLTVEHRRGPQAAIDVFRSLLAGAQRPDSSTIIHP